MTTYTCPRCASTVRLPIAPEFPPTCTCGRDDKGRGRLKPVEMQPARKEA